MSIMSVWVDEERTILRQIYDGRWTIESYHALINRTHKLLNGLDHTVHVIQDHTQSAGTPYNFLAAVRYAEAKAAPNQGLLIGVAMDEFAQSILPMARRLAPRAMGSIRTAATVEEALAIIAREGQQLAASRVKGPIVG